MASAKNKYDAAMGVMTSITDYKDEISEGIIDRAEGNKILGKPLKDTHGKIGAKLEMGAGFLSGALVGAAATNGGLSPESTAALMLSAQAMGTNAMKVANMGSLAITYSAIKKVGIKNNSDYQNVVTDVYKKANAPGGANSELSFEVGGLNNPEQPSHSVQVTLNGGYSADVIMDASTVEEYSDKKLKKVLDTPFTVVQNTDFRSLNQHVSSDPDERESAYTDNMKGLNMVELQSVRDKENGRYQANELNQAPIRELLDELENNPNNKDIYLNVSGAPYQYDAATRRMLPSTVQYSGESLKELLVEAQRSADIAHIDSDGPAKMDIVDLAYAHGSHSQEMRDKHTEYSAPKYVIDGGTREIKTDRNWTTHARTRLKSMGKGIVSGIQKVREMPGNFVTNQKRNLDAVVADMDMVMDYADSEQFYEHLAKTAAAENDLPEVAASPVSEYDTTVDAYNTTVDDYDYGVSTEEYDVIPDNIDIYSPGMSERDVTTEVQVSVDVGDTADEKPRKAPSPALTAFLEQAAQDSMSDIVAIQDRYVKKSLAESAERKDQAKQSGDYGLSAMT